MSMSKTLIRGAISGALLVGWAVLFAPMAQAQEATAGSGEEAAEAVDPNLEPLAIELPEPCYGGTPLNYESEHLEEISFKKRKPFLAPKGAANVAKGKVVTSSAPPMIGKLKMIVDGDKSAEEDSIVELPAGLQYVQVDLGTKYEVYAVVVWHYHAAERVYFDVIGRMADDPDFTENVTIFYNNDYDNSANLGVGEQKEYIDSYEGRLFDTKGKTARFVRLYSNGNTTDDMNQYLEIEVYGKPVE